MAHGNHCVHQLFANGIAILNNASDWINSQSMPEFAGLHKQHVFKGAISFGKGEMSKKSASINILLRGNSHFFFPCE